MRRSLNYADAVRILDGGEGALVEFLDRVAAVGLLTVGGISLAAACREFVRLGQKLLTGLENKVRGLDRTTRTERLRAAHTVIVVTAYFDAVEDAMADLLPHHAVRVGAKQQITAAGGLFTSSGLRGLAQALITVEAPWPVPSHSYEASLRDVADFYAGLAVNVIDYVSGLAKCDEFGEIDRDRFADQLRGPLCSLGVTKYEELFRRLAGDCPEFGIWANLSGHQATRSELRRGLADLERLLGAMASGQIPDQRRAALARAYQAALGKPITPAGEHAAQLRMPSLAEGYVDHRVRVAEITPAANPGGEKWWDGVPVRDDAYRFFAGYLTSPQAWEAPLVVLGQPGSGKSVLTRILAGRLPCDDFLPVRVELRQVPAEADLQSQIEFAIRASTGEAISWPRLVESSGGALPVVMLDGFDELLQATGVTQTDFLMRVMAFQEREADQGRRLAVIVTSRTAVVDRAHIPVGSAAVRLEPFDEEQISTWLEVWSHYNATALDQRGLRPLSLATALMHRELAEQPLLLLMLALYDADNNTLQRKDAEMGRTELYGQLLEEFAQREVLKEAGALADGDLGRAVEAELLRLSMIAFAMFNRRSQWVSETDLDTDLAALSGARTGQHRHVGLRGPLTAAQLAVGRFFFIHESQAISDEHRIETYEFLHATFGEFLVARLVVQVLASMVARETAAASSPFGSGPDDALLYALLSFAVLTARGPIMTFLADLLNALSAQHRLTLADLLLRLHAGALDPRVESTYASYQPRQVTATGRCAAWSANLVALAVIVAGEVTGKQLFPQDLDTADAWRREAMMWRSHLSDDEFSGMYQAVAMARIWDGDGRDVRLWLDDGTFRVPSLDLYWVHGLPPGYPERRAVAVFAAEGVQRAERRVNFTCGIAEARMAHALHSLGNMTHVVISLSENHSVSAANALIAAVIEPHDSRIEASSAYVDLAAAISVLAENSDLDGDYGAYLRAALFVLLSAVEHGYAPRELLESVRPAMTGKMASGKQLADLAGRLNALLPSQSQVQAGESE
jgi:hypothetical protein